MASTCLISLLALGAAQAACLHYEPTQVRISGTLVRQTFPGPPNFASVARGDTAETGYYLKTVKPLCTTAHPYEEASSYQNQHLVQLVLSTGQYRQLRPKLGQMVNLKGTLFDSSTGHHHTSVLMTVLSFD